MSEEIKKYQIVGFPKTVLSVNGVTPDDSGNVDVEGGSGGGSPAIIDVVELPTENINESSFYRLLTGRFVYNQFQNKNWRCISVETLPSIGEPVTTDMVNITAYYDASTNDVYGYINDILGASAGVPAGWYSLTMLAPVFGVPWNGIITDILDDPSDDSYRLLLEYMNYSYKEGRWVSSKTIGWAGVGHAAEIFNHPSNMATGDASHAEGYSSHAEGHYSHAEGYSSHAEGPCSHAEGDASHAEGAYSHAEGYASHAEGDRSHAEGSASHAEGYASHAEGYSSHAEGHYSHAEGNTSHAEGAYSHAEGDRSHAEGYASHAEGNTSHAEGYASHAEGSGDIVGKTITGSANSTVYTVNSVSHLILGASVRYTTNSSNGDSTHHTAKIIAIDTANNAITVNRTLSADTALSNADVMIYVSGMALGDSSHSEGSCTIAAGRSQHVQGEYNVIDPEYDVNDYDKRAKYAHIVGNGDYFKSSNAHTLDWNGLGWFAGGLKVGGTDQDDSAAKRVLTEDDMKQLVLTSPSGKKFELTVTDDGTLAATEIA